MTCSEYFCIAKNENRLLAAFDQATDLAETCSFSSRLYEKRKHGALKAHMMFPQEINDLVNKVNAYKI